MKHLILFFIHPKFAHYIYRYKTPTQSVHISDEEKVRIKDKSHQPTNHINTNSINPPPPPPKKRLKHMRIPSMLVESSPETPKRFPITPNFFFPHQDPYPHIHIKPKLLLGIHKLSIPVMMIEKRRDLNRWLAQHQAPHDCTWRIPRC